MSWFVFDCESDGPCPGVYSMTEVGVIKVQEPLVDAPTFYAKVKPDGEKFIQEALDVTNSTRESTLLGDDPKETMLLLEKWVTDNNTHGRPMFISDNNGFDFQFINYAMWKYLGRNVFGYSSTNLGTLYKGLSRSMFKNFKHLRKTKHTHDPVDDARGNAEALIAMSKMYNLKINFK